MDRMAWKEIIIIVLHLGNADTLQDPICMMIHIFGHFT